MQEYFLSDRSPIVVATNAFGMGIDRSDVRIVIHDQLPGSLEHYYQEAGRAGRDGAPALCVAFHTRGDRRMHRSFLDRAHPPVTPFRLASPESKEGVGQSVSQRLKGRQVGKARLRGIASYAARWGCRRRTILGWFGERVERRPCGGCDLCVGWTELLERTSPL